MEATEDSIVDISEAREKFFGCSGKMLIPCLATVEALINEIPLHKLITTDLLRQELAKRRRVQVTCPATTNTILRKISHAQDTTVPYWRVVKKNGELLAQFAGGLPDHAALLIQEGFTVHTDGKTPRVKNLSESLVCFN